MQRGCEESGTQVNSKNHGQLIKHIHSPKRRALKSVTSASISAEVLIEKAQLLTTETVYKTTKVVHINCIRV